MSNKPIAQPPTTGNPAFDRWAFLLWRRLLEAGIVTWDEIEFADSNLLDIETRNHNDLQNIQGGAPGEHYHLTSDQSEAVILSLSRVPPVFLQDDPEDPMVIPGPAGAKGETGSAGPMGFAVDGEDANDWPSPPGNTPPPPNTVGIEIRQEITGVISGGVLSAVAGTGVFSVSDGTGQIVDSYSDQLQPKIKNVSWGGFAGVADTFLASPVVYILIDSNGALVQTDTFPDQDTLRNHIGIGFLVHSGGAIRTVVPSPVLAYQNGYLAQDMLAALGTITNGCVYSGGTGLTLARTSGSVFRKGGHYATHTVTPNEAILGAVNPANIITHCRNGSDTVFSSSTSSTTIDVGVYDDGSVAASGLPSGVVPPNKWQAMRLYVSTTGVAVVQYGQSIHNSLADVVASISTENYFKDPLLNFSAFRGYMFVRGNATNLDDPDDAAFQAASKLGDALGSVPGVAFGGESTSTVVFMVPEEPEEPMMTMIPGPRGEQGVPGTGGGGSAAWVLAFAAAHG